MEMYNSLKCPEEELLQISTVSAVTEEASVETSVTAATTVTTEESQPKVIIKNPQKMMEDIFDVEVDSNRLDEENSQKTDLDLMVGDQPIADDSDDKKTLLKLQEKKQTSVKKPKNKKEKLVIKDDDIMMGDAPAEEALTQDQASTTEIPTTERQRRDANEGSDVTTASNDISASTTDVFSSSVSEDSASISSEISTTEVITSTITEEATAKIFVHGHPLHMSQAIFKDPILPDINNTHERIGFGAAEDRFIPPMLLVKAKFATTTLSGEPTKELTTDVIATSSQSGSLATEQADVTAAIDVTENADESTMTNEIPTNDTDTQVENAITSAAATASSEKPILIGKRNDPRLGLNVITSTTTTVLPPSSTADMQISTTEISSTMNEELTSVTDEINSSSISSSSIDDSTLESSTTSTTDEITSDIASSSTIHEEISTALNAEKLIESTTIEATTSQPITITPIAIKEESPIAVTSKVIADNKSTTTMRNDIDAHHQPIDEIHDLPHSEDVEENNDSSEEDEHHHLENNFSNAENYQPYKPHRHRIFSKLDHHHGPGFTLGKILG